MTKKNQQTKDTLPLQSQMDKLSAIVEKLEKSEISLEESLALYEQGMTLVSTATATLEAAEQRVAIVTKDGEIQPLES